jgi:ATP sulfurylase
MAKLLELPTDRGICAIPLKHAVYCRGCQTVSNSRPRECRLCGSDRVVRLEPILDGSPDPPAQGVQEVHLALVRAVSA